MHVHAKELKYARLHLRAAVGTLFILENQNMDIPSKLKDALVLAALFLDELILTELGDEDD